MLRARVLLQNSKTLTYNFSDKNVSLALEFTHKLDKLIPMHNFLMRKV